MSSSSSPSIPSVTFSKTFRIFAQPSYVAGFQSPVEVKIKTETQIARGPSDSRFIVVSAGDEFVAGISALPTVPFSVDPDQIATYQPGTAEFSACQMYATVRLVLNVFEQYNFKVTNQRTFRFTGDRDNRIVLIPRVTKWAPDAPNDWRVFPFNNAYSTGGRDSHLAFGFPLLESGSLDLGHPYCENFDVLAHEMGHTLVQSLVGNSRRIDFGGFNESMGDVVAFITVLHIKSFRLQLLNLTKGNVAGPNVLTDAGELPSHRSIRQSLNLTKYNPDEEEVHNVSVPFTGALTDFFLKKYFDQLKHSGQDATKCDLAFERRFAKRPSDHPSFDGFDVPTFNTALKFARDALGKTLVKLWKTLSDRGVSDFTYSLCLTLLLNNAEEADRHDLEIFFANRNIRPLPRRHLAFDRVDSHV